MSKFKQTLNYILKRLALMVLTFVVIFFICFILVRLLPTTVDSGMKDPEIFYKTMVSQGRMKQVVDQYGKVTYVTTPVFEQLWIFLKGLFTPGNPYPWGLSYKIEWLNSPIDVLTKRLPSTVLINIYSMLISIPCGIGLGIFMALKKNKWQDHVLSVLVMLFISVPSFVYAFLMQYLFSYVWQILPSMTESSSVGWFSWAMIKSMILPVLSMCFGSIAGFARYTRAELTEVLTSDFMLLARTKGLTRAQATVRHAFRNSLVPIFPMILGEIISVLSGSLIIENIFSINGVGALYLQSIQMRDYDVFQFVSMFYITIGLFGTLVVDVSYGIVDPRIRMGGGK
ncbi:MAG: ABC transporter permease [Bacilli bacterium]|nr:ABC transporter permease [Bacilli bacterium]